VAASETGRGEAALVAIDKVIGPARVAAVEALALLLKGQLLTGQGLADDCSADRPGHGVGGRWVPGTVRGGLGVLRDDQHLFLDG
jgi:hypothetical protein